MRWLLNCVYLIAGVVLFPYWLWKLPRAERYRSGIRERLGFAPRMGQGRRRLWMHCASIGEAAIPRQLVARLRELHPDWEVVFSTNTDTGARRLHELYPGRPVFFMPLDFSLSVRLALRRVWPDAVILVELEVWPNFLDACRRQGVPVAIVNGRIRPGSRKLLGGLSRVWAGFWSPVRACCARSREDADGFVKAGLPPELVHECGMLKCDGLPVQPDPDRQGTFRKLFAIARDAPVLVAGSTHPGEEALLATAYRELRRTHRRLRMVVVPRHIERAREALAAVRARGLPVAAKTDLEAGKARVSGSEVIVVDTVGDLVACYGLATCAFVGRSLLPPGGGQNVLEPAALGVPVLTGPYTANFGPEMDLLTSEGAARVVHSVRELIREAGRVLSDPVLARGMGAAGRMAVRASTGATERTLERLEPVLQEASRREAAAEGRERPTPT